MSRAQVEQVTPDLERGRQFLAQARLFLRDADTSTLGAASSFFLYYQAALAGLDALLASRGHRVTSGEESHRVRIEAAAALAGAGHEELFERLDVWRADRHAVSYAALDPTAAAVDALRTDVHDLLDVVARLLD